jgi:hypothetical protein
MTLIASGVFHLMSLWFPSGTEAKGTAMMESS